MAHKLAIGQSEYLLQNAIDSEIKAFSRPLNLMQSTFLMSMYNIYDNFITYRSFASITISFLSVVVATVIYILRVVLNSFEDTFLYINNLFDSVYYSLGFAIIFYVCIVYKDHNINLVLKIQDLYRSRTITQNVLRKLTKNIWVNISFSGFFFVITTATTLYLYEESKLSNFFEIVFHFVLLAFDVNVIYITQIIRILTSASRQWVDDLKYYTNIKNIVKSLKGNETRNPYWKYKESTFASILEAFQITKDVFQLLILYHCTETFIHAIFYIYVVTLIFRSNVYYGGPAAVAILIGWIVKNFFYETVLCIEFERFLIALNDATVNSIFQTKNEECSEHERQMHRNVVRMSRLAHKFKVCNLFALDATMPRQLLSLIATYTIVLLQFVLLKNN